MSVQFTPISGAYLQDDNNPSGSTLSLSGSIENAIIDGNYCATAFYLTAPHKWSAGVDLGSVKVVTEMILYDWFLNQAGIWGGGGYDHIQIWRSDDNSNWILVQDYHPPTRVVGSDPGCIDFKMVCTLSTPATARYWKMNASENGLCSAAGGWLYMAEIDIYGLVPEAKQQTILSDAHVVGPVQQTILSDAVAFGENQQLITSDAHIFPASSPDPFVFESTPAYTSFSLKTKDESKLTLLDVKLKHTCDHNLPSGKYNLNSCPRCLGKGYYFDIKFSPRGDVLTVSEIEKLLQELVKITLTSKGGNFFHDEYGSHVSDSIGMVQSKNFREARLKQSIIDAVLRLRYLQRDGIEKGYRFSLKELIDKISKIEIYEIENNPTQLGFKVTVQTVEGMTAILQGSVTL